ncbi:MAG: MDR family MFS transporter [Thermincola sp.]|jgi:EmrB/QacA subfamily drug resistance transporter|nr:MDR family MFS transporter [Thermincola sp.]MDT3702424.1 MDR family MFS transporter [Thermincola sp.]
MKETNNSMVLLSLLVGMFITAIEINIVSTAMPSIVADLGGFSLLSWVFSAFLLTQVVSIPIYGKLADLFGRKPVFVTGVLIFLAGSLACGLAPSMNMLIIFRFIQGIGAGAVHPIALTIVGDIYPLRERARVQAYISTVFGVSAVIGPALGGIFVQYTSWAWVFWINIPLGILAIIGVSLFLHEKIEQRNPSIDYLGSGLLFITISSLMIVLIQGGVTWAWDSMRILVLGTLFLTGMILFIFHEGRATEPVMPLMLWKNRLIAVPNLASLTSGIVMIGVTAFLPTYVQGIMGGSPMAAGFAIGGMSLGWPATACVTGRLMLRLGPRKTAAAGGVMLLLGSLLLVNLHPQQGPLYAAISAFFIGNGMGLTAVTSTLSIQNSVDWQMRGAATASNQFMRILGNTLGAAFLGSILNSYMSGYLKTNAGKVQLSSGLDATTILLDPNQRQSLSQGALEVMREGLAISLHNVYMAVFVLAVLTLILTINFPETHKTLQKSEVSANKAG